MSKIISDTIQGRSKDPNVNAGITIAGVTTASSDVRITGNINAGIATFSSISGDGSGLSNVGVDTATVDASTLQVSGISTFKNELKVTAGGVEIDAGGLDVAGVGTFAAVVDAGSDVRITGNLNAGITTTSSLVNATPLSHRNLIINGAMKVAQYGTSSTYAGYGGPDRWKHEYAGTDANPTFAQAAVTSSDSGDNPFYKGMTNCFKITNADQSSDLQAASLINFNQQIEAQNIRNSGWNYNSSSSYITLSYYIKASVTQEYHGFVKTVDGTNYAYPFSLGTLTADTWTRIIKTIPGNSNLQIDDNTESGFQVFPIFFAGTNYTNDSITEDAWAAWASGNRSHDQTATWYNTNGATIEITGVQLEVGPVATPFENRTYADELTRCERYYQLIAPPVAEALISDTHDYDNYTYFTVDLHTIMRGNPALVISNFTNAFRLYGTNARNVDTLLNNTGVTTPSKLQLYATGGSSGAVGFARVFSADSGGDYATIAANAEI